MEFHFDSHPWLHIHFTTISACSIIQQQALDIVTDSLISRRIFGEEPRTQRFQSFLKYDRFTKKPSSRHTTVVIIIIIEGSHQLHILHFSIRQ